MKATARFTLIKKARKDGGDRYEQIEPTSTDAKGVATYDDVIAKAIYFEQWITRGFTKSKTPPRHLTVTVEVD